MTLRLTALAAVATALTVPATASAATLTVDPTLPCYGSGHSVNLLGTGFTPGQMGGVAVTRNGESIGALSTDATGAFNGSLRLGQRNGRRTSTYTATDMTNPTLTASTQVRLAGAEGAHQGGGVHDERRKAALGPRDAQQQDPQPARREAEGRMQGTDEEAPPAAARRPRRRLHRSVRRFQAVQAAPGAERRLHDHGAARRQAGGRGELDGLVAQLVS